MRRIIFIAIAVLVLVVPAKGNWYSQIHRVSPGFGDNGEWRCTNSASASNSVGTHIRPIDNSVDSNHVPVVEASVANGVADVFKTWADRQDLKKLTKFAKLSVKLSAIAGPLADILGTFLLSQVDSPELQAIKNLSKEMKQQFNRVHDRLKDLKNYVEKIHNEAEYNDAMQEYETIILKLNRIQTQWNYMGDLSKIETTCVWKSGCAVLNSTACKSMLPYRENKATTPSRTCQRWDSQSPQKHPSIIPANYPKADLQNNYCRNPDGEPGPWCYTTDTKKRWELCFPDCRVPATNNDCKATCAAKSQVNAGGVVDGKCLCITRPVLTQEEKDIIKLRKEELLKVCTQAGHGPLSLMIDMQQRVTDGRITRPILQTAIKANFDKGFAFNLMELVLGDFVQAQLLIPVCLSLDGKNVAQIIHQQELGKEIVQKVSLFMAGLIHQTFDYTCHMKFCIKRSLTKVLCQRICNCWNCGWSCGDGYCKDHTSAVCEFNIEVKEKQKENTVGECKAQKDAPDNESNRAPQGCIIRENIKWENSREVYRNFWDKESVKYSVKVQEVDSADGSDNDDIVDISNFHTVDRETFPPSGTNVDSSDWYPCTDDNTCTGTCQKILLQKTYEEGCSIAPSELDNLIDASSRKKRDATSTSALTVKELIDLAMKNIQRPKRDIEHLNNYGNTTTSG